MPITLVDRESELKELENSPSKRISKDKKNLLLYIPRGNKRRGDSNEKI